jgi:hypothetical protein
LGLYKTTVGYPASLPSSAFGFPLANCGIGPNNPMMPAYYSMATGIHGIFQLISVQQSPALDDQSPFRVYHQNQ